ncbi:MAG TPA: hypothetical protein VFY98_01415, partial [Intrasporangium sp.]|nr:hypothetical protein [Intrasporangium sp.]
MPFRVTVTGKRDESTGRVKRSLHLPPGVTEWELRNRRYRKLFHGVYVHRDTSITEWMKAFGALLLCADNAAASHHTAAR